MTAAFKPAEAKPWPMRLLALAAVLLLAGCAARQPNDLVATGPCAAHLDGYADDQLLVHVSVSGPQPDWTTMQGQIEWTRDGKDHTSTGKAFPDSRCMRFEVGPADDLHGFITLERPDREGCQYTVTLEGSHPGGLVETEGFGATGLCG